MAQAVICQQLIMKASGQSRKVHVEICHTFWKWDWLISEYFCLPLYHSINAPYSYFIHLPTLHYFRTWQHHYIKH
jgi:hypothetical protein